MISRVDIDGGKGFDWGRVSADYARFRDIYPEAFYERIVGLGLCVEGQRVLDLGTGTGVLPRNMYKYGAKFVGADIAENQIEWARRLTAEAGMDIEYVVAPAEEVDFADGTFDVVTACQCFAYFDKDVIFERVHRLLRAGGHFCILFMAWLPAESAIAAGTEELILKHNPAWAANGMERFVYEVPAQADGLFVVEDAFHFDVPVWFTRESWHGRIKACRGIGASSLTAEEIAAFEVEHLAYLDGLAGMEAGEAFEIPHFAMVLNLRKV